jgi:hypothetical protein
VNINEKPTTVVTEKSVNHFFHDLFGENSDFIRWLILF